MTGVTRAGIYYRVYKPGWANPLDMEPGRKAGGRWNKAGSFGVLYLNATIDVAAANARWQHRGRAIGLFDLQPNRRPRLLTIMVPKAVVLDVVSAQPIADLNLPKTYPWEVSHEKCQAIGAKAYAEKRLRGIACRSAAECTPSEWVGEELAWFDRSPALKSRNAGRSFEEWYPGPYPK